MRIFSSPKDPVVVGNPTPSKWVPRALKRPFFHGPNVIRSSRFHRIRYHHRTGFHPPSLRKQGIQGTWSLCPHDEKSFGARPVWVVMGVRSRDPRAPCTLVCVDCGYGQDIYPPHPEIPDFPEEKKTHKNIKNPFSESTGSFPPKKKMLRHTLKPHKLILDPWVFFQPKHFWLWTKGAFCNFRFGHASPWYQFRDTLKSPENTGRDFKTGNRNRMFFSPSHKKTHPNVMFTFDFIHFFLKWWFVSHFSAFPLWLDIWVPQMLRCQASAKRKPRASNWKKMHKKKRWMIRSLSLRITW